MPSYVLAIDQGTTSSRAILFDEAGQIATVAQKDLTQFYPQPGWVEHDPDEIWAGVLEVAQRVVSQVGAENVAAIGITNQRETTLVWDRTTGETIHPAIVWQDRRTAEACERLAGSEELIRRKTGLVIDSYFSATKLAWLLDNVPGARRRAEAGELAHGTVDSFLVWRLTKGRVHATDPSNASRTMLFDIETRRWDDELLELFDIPHAVLPSLVPSSGIVGETSVFGRAIPISGIAGDQQAATFGQCCIRPGMAKNTYGTGCFLLMNVGSEMKASGNRLLSTIAWQVEGRTEYALEGSVFVAGAAIQWLRDELGLITSASESAALAASVSSTGGVYLVPAFVGLGAPYWDSAARGTITGLTRGSGRAKIVRAALESIAYQSRDVLEAMQADCGIELSELRVDGGAASNDWLMQFQADILGIPVIRPKITETTALGAAYLAGLAVGFWKAEELESQWKVDRVFDPVMGTDLRENLYAGWQAAVGKARD